jgi:uncharacterized Ntn-hydrolase superfamily protein
MKITCRDALMWNIARMGKVTAVRGNLVTKENAFEVGGLKYDEERNNRRN